MSVTTVVQINQIQSYYLGEKFLSMASNLHSSFVATCSVQKHKKKKKANQFVEETKQKESLQDKTI